MKANPARQSQRVWTMLRLVPAGLTTATLSDVTAVPASTVKHLLMRWRREGLVEVGGEVGGDDTLNGAYVWRLARDLGAVAPILRGQVLTGQGYTDPNVEADHGR